MYSCSPTLSQISCFFQILAKIEMTRNKNRLFGRHFETVQHFQYFFFFAELWFFIVHTYRPMVQISLQNLAGKVIFYGWAPKGVKVPWSWCLAKTKQKETSKNMSNTIWKHKQCHAWRDNLRPFKLRHASYCKSEHTQSKPSRLKATVWVFDTNQVCHVWCNF